jgi:hypothetical protein
MSWLGDTWKKVAAWERAATEKVDAFQEKVAPGLQEWVEGVPTAVGRGCTHSKDWTVGQAKKLKRKPKDKALPEAAPVPKARAVRTHKPKPVPAAKKEPAKPVDPVAQALEESGVQDVLKWMYENPYVAVHVEVLELPKPKAPVPQPIPKAPIVSIRVPVECGFEANKRRWYQKARNRLVNRVPFARTNK